MNAYNPLESMKRLEAAGIERRHAEAIAGEIREGTDQLVTDASLKQQLDAAIDRVTVKFGIMTATIVGIATAILGVLISIK